MEGLACGGGEERIVIIGATHLKAHRTASSLKAKTICYDKRRTKRRNRIEIMFGRLEDGRWIATRYDRGAKGTFLTPPMQSQRKQSLAVFRFSDFPIFRIPGVPPLRRPDVSGQPRGIPLTQCKTGRGRSLRGGTTRQLSFGHLN